MGEERGVKRSEKVAAVRSGGISTEEDASLVFARKRKFYCEEEILISPLEERASVSSNSKVDEERRMRAPDLEDVDSNSEDGEFGVESLTSINEFFSRESSPSSDFCGDCEEVIFQTPYPPRRRPASPLRKTAVHVTQVMPSVADLEEFFAAAEKHDHKRFAEKYNYDIVMDIPLEGRYQWVRIQP